MELEEDAHGQQIIRYYNGKRSFSVVERDDGYVNLDEDEANRYLSSYKRWKKHEKDAIKYARGRCLDVGCAAGRVPIYLQKKGLYCLGIDISPLAIKVCRLRGVKYCKVMSIADIGKLRGGLFDTVIMFGIIPGSSAVGEKQSLCSESSIE